MADSLVIDGQIELLEGGVPTTNALCAGATFQLYTGWDLGVPQPISAIIGSLLLDGERPIGDRFSNRTFVIPVLITGTSRLNLAAARELLLSTVNQDSFSLTWCRDSGYNLVFDCMRAGAATINWDLKADRANVGVLTVTFQALPFGHSDVPQVLAFQGTVGGSGGPPTPPSPITLDGFTEGTMGGSGAQWGQNQTGGMPCVSGDSITVVAEVFSTTNVRACMAGVQFCNSSGTVISTLSGSTVNDSAGGVSVSATVTAPANTAYAIAHIQVNSVVNNEVHLISFASMERNSGTNWLSEQNTILTNQIGTWVGGGGTKCTYSAPQQALQMQANASGNMAVQHCGSGSAVKPTSTWGTSTSVMPGSTSAHWAPTSGANGSAAPAPIWISASENMPVSKASWDFTVGATGANAGVPQLTSLQHWVGCASTGWYSYWKSGNLTLAYIIEDINGNTCAFGVNVPINSATPYTAPNWERVNVSIPWAGSAVDWTQVVQVSVGVTNQSGNILEYTDLYINNFQAIAPTSSGFANTRGTIFNLTGIVGTAHAPLTLQAALPRTDTNCSVAATGGSGTNALTGDTAVFNGTIGTWVTDLNCAVTYQTTFPYAGSTGSMRMASSAAGSMNAFSGTQVPVVAGQVVYTSAYFRPGTVGRACQVGVAWYNAGGYISSSLGSTTTSATGAWTQATGAVTVPAGATGAMLEAQVVSTAGASEMHYVGNASLALNNIVLDSAAVNGDLYASIACAACIPTGATITAVNPGVGYTISLPTSAVASGQTFLVSSIYFNTLLLHRPNPDAPAMFNPLVGVNATGTDVPNAKTNYIVQPLTAGQNAQFAGTYSIVLVASSWNAPTALRTVTVSVNQYEYGTLPASGTTLPASGSYGPAHIQSVSRTFVPSTDAVNGIISIGEMTLPVQEMPSSNNQSFFTVNVGDTNLSDVFYDAIFIDTLGQTVLINIPSTRSDSGCATTSGSVTVTDPSAIAADKGASISGTGIPVGDWILAVSPGVGYTLGMSATATNSGLTFSVSTPEYGAYNTFFVNAPDTMHDVGIIAGSNSDQTRATSVLDNTFVSGGPLTVDPGGEIILGYSTAGVPGLTASYFPAWWLDRLA